MRIADIDGHRALKTVPTNRHVARIHRHSERDKLPIKCGRWQRHRRARIARFSMQYTAHCLNFRGPLKQQRDTARCIAARLNLTAIGIEYPHFDVRHYGRLKQNELIKTNPSLAITNRVRAGRGHIHRRFTRINHDKIIAEAVHFVKSRLHACLRCSPFTQRTVPELARMTTVCVVIVPPFNTLTPSSSDPSVTPVAAKMQSPLASSDRS